MTVNPVVPWWLVVSVDALALAALTLLYLRNSKRARSAASAGLPSFLRCAGIVVCLSLALMRPGLGSANAQEASRNLDVIVAVDTSTSVSAEDWDGRRKRLEGIKADLTALLKAAPGAHWSLITFDQAAVIRVPLTSDTTAMQDSIDALAPEASASSRGSSITLARDVVKSTLESAKERNPDRSRVVLYLGDGEQTAAESPKPFDIDTALVNRSVVMGYGTEAGGKMLYYSQYSGYRDYYIRDEVHHTDAVSKIDQPALQKLAQQLHGVYDHREAGKSLTVETSALQDAGLQAQAGSGVRAAFELYWILAMGATVLATWELAQTVISARRQGLLYSRRSKAGAS